MAYLLRASLATLVAAGLLSTAGCGDTDGGAGARRDAERFVTLPDGARLPEGIAVNPANGDVYVATFDVPSAVNPKPENQLLRFDRDGALIASKSFGRTPLLGLAFDARDGTVYIASVGDLVGGDSKIQRVVADLSGLTDVATIPEIGAPGRRTVTNPDGSSDTIAFGARARFPNAMVFDRAGDLYVSDSFQGAILKIASILSTARRAAIWPPSATTRCWKPRACRRSRRTGSPCTPTDPPCSSQTPATTASSGST